VASSPSRLSLSKVSAPDCSRDTPPPATTPSSTAALALRTASSMRCLRSLSSTSVAAPARMTAPPPARFARRSRHFSRSSAESEFVEGGRAGLQQGHAATGDDALVHGGLGVAHRVLDAVLALLELDLGGGAGPDDGHTAGQLRQALLQLLAVVVGVGVLDLAT